MNTLTPISIKVKNIMKYSDNEKLLGVTVDANLNFNRHLENILKKASKKSSSVSENCTLYEYP